MASPICVAQLGGRRTSTASTRSSTASAPTTPDWRCCSCPGAGGVAVVDPIAVDVAPLAKVLAGPGAVRHARRQPGPRDPRSASAAPCPSRLFDTQVAAGFVGYSSVGLGRPRPGRARRQAPQGRSPHGLAGPAARRRTPSTYAAADVAHLHELHDRLVAKLEARGRLRVGARRVRGAPHPRPVAAPVPDRAWWKIKEARSLRGPGRGGRAGRWRHGGSARRPTSTGPCGSCSPTWPSWRWRSGRPPPRTTSSGCGASTTGKRKGQRRQGAARRGRRGPGPRPRRGAGAAVARASTARRRAAASLVSAWAAQRAQRPRHRRRHPRHPVRHRDVPHGRSGAAWPTGWRNDVVGEPIRALAAGEASLAVDA